jgi:hypothetical protein
MKRLSQLDFTPAAGKKENARGINCSPPMMEQNEKEA